ncbi:uncharacterized protein LOC110112892 [Dendrobium catenatum]|uniref:uncharacterized protein LOC110112892 n=1 Tax=Dendrobium catenatum TaxID=906689 RepID=UPI0009F5740F|nr:uncharacterized protein LOC110112892 [Dendrobium catenatum]
MTSGIEWDVAVVYAHKDTCITRSMWDDISRIHNRTSPLLVRGDFNCIMAPNEKKGGSAFHMSPAACDMADFMMVNDLIDPWFVGPAFTWTNNKDAGSKIFSRLDRFIVSSDIMDEFQGLRVRHLSRLVSDHCPILCSIFAETKINYSPWFRFEDVWVNYPKARQLVMDKWNDGDHGSEAVQLQRKYSRTLKALFFWSRNKFKMINKQKDELDSEIQKLQELDREPGGLSEAQKEKLRFNVHLFNSTLARILMWWKQRAKVRWVEEGDGNTGFFHSMTSAQRRSKRIESIKREDEMEGAGIVESGWPALDGHQRNINQFSGLLDGDVSEEEILKAVNSLGWNKAPGKEGITASFFKAYWDIEEQAAFIPGRSITTHCLLGQELIHKFKVSKAARGFFPLKVDMEQAYDKMSWRTSEIILGRLGIPPRFGAWVLSCVMGPRFFILTNGKFSNLINAECGFRQGCPLPPYLFILCSELLSVHFKQNFREMGVPISLGGPPISHLLYADDILFFAGASSTKSTILFSKRTPSTTKDRLTKLMGCYRVDEFEYMGIMFAMRWLTRLYFAPLVQRARAHSLSWAFRHLSMAGRVTLINSVLLPSSVFLMTHTIIPKAVLHEIEKICCSFLWDKDSEHRACIMFLGMRWHVQHVKAVLGSMPALNRLGHSGHELLGMSLGARRGCSKDASATNMGMIYERMAPRGVIRTVGR